MAVHLPYRDTIKNMYIPGLNEDGQPRTLVANDFGYWAQQASDQRRGGPGDLYLPEVFRALANAFRRAITPTSHPMGHKDGLGLATAIILDQERFRPDGSTYVHQRTFAVNIVTDTGAQALLSNSYNAPVGTAAKYIVLHTDNATAVQTGGTISSGAQTSITVVSGGNKGAVTGNKAGSYISNTTNSAPSADSVTGGGIDWSYGTSNSEIVSGSGTQSSAGAVAITSYTVAKTHSNGDYVVSRPQTGDAPSSAPAGAIMYNSSASTSGATGTAAPATVSGTGIGNRQAAWTSIVVANTSSTAGTYTGLCIVNITTIASWAASEFYNSLSFPGQVVNNSQQLTLTSYLVKL